MIKKHLHSFGLILVLALSTLVIAGIVILIVTKPRKGEAPMGTTGTNQPVQQPSGQQPGSIAVSNLVSGQAISTPMTVTGTVPGGWFFEGSFPVFMKDVNGYQIGVGLASSTEDWMTSNTIPFSVTLPAVTYQGPGVIVFTKDNPSGLPQFDESYTLQVVFQ